jgi:ribose 5-phosphate isomerase B
VYVRIAVGSDHVGVDLKAILRKAAEDWGHTVVDVGPHEGQTGVDYVDYAVEVTKSVAAGTADCGILVCGTGLGMSMAANKVSGIRAALCHDTYTARMSRLHNDANVLCLGARVLGEGVAIDVVEIWLQTPFSAVDRHQRRIDKIAAIQ